MSIIILILLLIVIIGVCGIFYINTYNKIQSLILRIQESEVIIDDCLRKKYDLLEKEIGIIKSKTKVDENIFNDFYDLKNKEISNFNMDRNLCKQDTLIKQVISDYEELEKNNEIKDLFKDITHKNEKLEATKIFYNKYTKELNEKIRTFPSNLISKIHNIKLLNYFDNKDMNDDIVDDFKL